MSEKEKEIFTLELICVEKLKNISAVWDASP